MRPALLAAIALSAAPTLAQPFAKPGPASRGAMMPDPARMSGIPLPDQNLPQGTLTVLIGLYGLIILWKIVSGEINISKLISEPDGSGASLSRFQFLIFTFVVSMSLFWVIVRQEGFPEEIPSGIFVLLGISGGSYVISKGIQPRIKTKPEGESPGKKTKEQ